MFYKMIEAKRNKWLASGDCTVKTVIDYIAKTNQMRDAQVEAIKTYLFLKIACSCKPLAELFCEGVFNTLDLDDLEVSHSTREYLKENKAAAALFEYACLINGAGEQVSPKLEQQIRKEPESIDYISFFRKAFYGLSYTDYLFSLPMGAGKTYLMAAFYLSGSVFCSERTEESCFRTQLYHLCAFRFEVFRCPQSENDSEFRPHMGHSRTGCFGTQAHDLL